MTDKPMIQGVMTTFPHSIGVDQSVSTAKEMMVKYSIRHLPVQEGGKLVGVVSDRDINFVLAFDDKHEDQLKVEDVYTADPYVVKPNASLDKVVMTMAREHYGCALVAENDKLLGIFTTVDVCRAFGEYIHMQKQVA